MKSGIGAGAIAGIVAGIVAVIITFLMTIAGIMSSIPGMSIPEWLAGQIGVHIIWGAIVGALFAKFYGSISGKGAMKGINLNMILFLFTGLQPFAWLIFMKMPAMAIGWLIIDFFARLAHGPVLGTLYKK